MHISFNNSEKSEKKILFKGEKDENIYGWHVVNAICVLL